MSKVCRTISWTSLALGLTVTMATGAIAQEPIPQPETPPVEEPAQVAEPQEPVVVQLSAVGGAEGAGEATLSAGAVDGTDAVIEVQGLAPGTQWSAFLVAGTCDQPGDAISPLGTIEVADQGSGRGEASVTAALGDLAGAGATVQVHPQGDTPTQAVLCGSVPAAGAAAAPLF